MFYFRDIYPNRGNVSTGTKTVPEPLEAMKYLGGTGGRRQAGIPAPAEVDPASRAGVPLAFVAFLILIILLGR